MIIGELVYCNIEDSDYSDASQDVYASWLGQGVDHFELIAPGLVTEVEFNSRVSDREAMEILEDIVFDLDAVRVCVKDWYLK